MSRYSIDLEEKLVEWDLCDQLDDDCFITDSELDSECGEERATDTKSSFC